MSRVFRQCLTYAFCLGFFWAQALQAAENGFVLSLQKSAQENVWILSWPAQPGAEYTLQKSANLSAWGDVLTLTAQSNIITQTDSGLTNEFKTFWRVLRSGGDTNAVTASTVVASYQLAAGSSQAMLRVLAGGTQIVTNVLFFDNGVLLGNATPGIGDTWSFRLVWDGVSRQARNIFARVFTDQGASVDSPTRTFLLADPKKFVPLNPDGTPAYGQFVPMDSAGNLGQFLLYPEGLGDVFLTTGAHIEFPQGASLTGQGDIQFGSAKLHRGHKDPAPLPARSGAHTINADALTSAVVAGTFGSADLLWNFIPLKWIDGTLSAEGWAALKVIPPLDFILPQGHECVLVSLDPKSGNPALVICYHGQWGPFGPVQFRIPKTDPLKIYISLDGQIAAHATVEADFQNGPQVRGTVSWRDPNFEFRFQGRNITIPALASLKRTLPANPELLIPSGNTPAELDAAAQALASFRDIYRALAMGGLTEASTTSTETLAPISEPTDQAGTALQAWASRLESWPADRAGQILDAEQLTDLRKVVENAARTGEAAHDLPTALKLLRDFVVVSRNASSAAGASAEASALLAVLPQLEARLFAAAARILTDLPNVKSGLEFKDSTRLLTSLRQITSSPAALSRASSGIMSRQNDADPVGGLGDLLVNKSDATIFNTRGIEEGVHDGEDNQLLGSHSLDELLSFLDEVQDAFDLLVSFGRIRSLDDPLSPYPLDEAVSQTEFWLSLRHGEFCTEALQKSDAASLITALRQRLRILDRYAALRLPIPPDGDPYFPTIHELTLALEDPFAQQLRTAPSQDRLKLLNPVTDLLKNLSRHVQHPDLTTYLDGTWLELSDANSVILDALSGLGDCDSLESDLIQAGFRLKNLPLGNEGLYALPIVGKYETIATSNTDIRRLRTLQVNQAGRYFFAYINTVPSRQSTRGRLEGILTEDGPDGVEYAFRRIDGSGNLHFGILSATRDADQRVRIVLGEPGNILTFRQTTILPIFAETVIESFVGRTVQLPNRAVSYTDRSRQLVASTQRFPLHSRQLELLLESLPTAVDAITNFVNAGPDLNAQRPHVSHLNTLFQAIRDNLISVEQLPQWHLVYQQALSKSRPPGSTRTYWENIMVMHANHAEQMPHLNQLLSGSPVQTGNSGVTYTYDVTVNGAGAEISPQVFKLGLAGIRVHIVKTASTGASDTFDLIGGVAQGGAGADYGFDFGELSATTNLLDFLQSVANFSADKAELDAAILGIDERQTITTHIDYRKEDLAGPVLGLSGEAAVALELPTPFGTGELKLFNINASGLALMGTGLLPPLVLAKEPPPEGPGTGLDRGKVTFKGGFEASFTATAGYLWDEGDALELLTKPAPFRFRPSQDVAIDRALFFDIDSDQIKPCGWQFLRRLASEYSAIFLSPRARVRILGMTDTTGTAAHNADLSHRRAQTNKTALLTILGPLLGVDPDEEVRAVGLGEQVALGVDPATISSLEVLALTEPWLVDFLRRRQQILGTVADETDAPQWRSVVIILNDTAVLELTDPTP